MGNVVLPLAAPVAGKASLSGTKGAMLAKMIGAGLPVPEGFVVTTEAFRTVVGNLPAVEKLKKQSPKNHVVLERASAKVRAAILAVQLPQSIESEIRTAFGAMGGTAVSARSSSTAEDLAEASFAGQYDSFLNIRHADDLIARIKDVWVSLFSVHAVSYRHRYGIPFEKASMAVVVQRQLDPVVSGVLFTRDPVSQKHHYVVTAALGLGEGVVAGTVESDRFVLDPRTGKVLTSEIASKTARVVATETGGVEVATVPGDRGEAPALTARQLSALAGYGRKLVRLSKGPQDIEFAVVKGKTQILQARAMTAIDEVVEPDESWDAGVDKRFTWHRRGGVRYRLEADYTRAHAEHMRVCYGDTGFGMTANHLLHFSNGYAFARSNPHDADTLAKIHKRHARRVDVCVRKGKTYFEGVIREKIEKRLAELKAQRAAVSNLADLSDYLEACIQMAAWVQGDLHWRQIRPGKWPDWPKTFHEITGEPPLNAHLHTLAVRNRMTRLIARIRELAKIAQGDRVLKRLFLDRRFDDLSSSNVKSRAAGVQFWKRFRAMLHVYGQRNGAGYGTNSNFATPTWNMDWTIPFEMIASYVEQDLGKLDRMERTSRAKRIRETRRMRRKLANEPKKLKRFNEGVVRAVMMVRNLEDHNYYMEQCSIGTMREAIYEMGAALVAKDLIAHPDDVLHLSLEELKAIARDPAPEEQRALVRERERDYALRKRMKPPETIGKSPEPESDGGEKGETEKRGLDGNVIRGAAASVGRAKGRAVVALPGQPRPKVHPGDILVAPNVGPDWTPTFAVIEALVLDSGSLWQHAALVARECRIPAVMMTREASKIIRTGQIITVDGDRGIVELDRSGAR